MGNDERINLCPKCFTPYFKDESCEHVRCHSCKIDFCFRCSCLRQPTLNHGNHFHRKECPFFFPVEGTGAEDDFDPVRCEVCKKNKKACKKPQSYRKFCKAIVSKEFYDKYLKRNIKIGKKIWRNTTTHPFK